MRALNLIVLLALAGVKVPSILGGIQIADTYSDGALLALDQGRLEIRFVTDRIARVRATPDPTWSARPSLMRVEVGERPGKIRVKHGGDSVELASSLLKVVVDGATGAVSYHTIDGRRLLSENPDGPRRFERVDVIKTVADPASVSLVKTADGERPVATRHVRAKDREAWQATVAFRFADDEVLQGLGFDEASDLDLRGKTKRLYQHNMRVVIPSLVSTRGYGLLFDAYSAMTFSDGDQGGSLTLDVVEDLDYYFILGPDMDGAVAGYRQLTGGALMPSRWALGYIQSKEHYRTQKELVDTVRQFRDRDIPLDVIVQDWNYWKSGQWGGDIDPKRYPDIPRLVRDLHALNTRLMISIWPNPSKKSAAGSALHVGGHTLAGSPWTDFSSFDARKVYWDLAVWQPFGCHGVDGWWCDSTEPEVADWVAQRPPDHDAVNIDGLARIIDPQYLNAYGFWSAQGIFENERASRPDHRVLNLTRSGYAGGQRLGAVIWTGDVTATWDTLAKEVCSLQSISAAGYPYVTTDAGAFFVKTDAQWFWRGHFDRGVDDLGYRELYTRWLQFSTMLPLFRSHGTDTPREPWRFGEPGTPFYDGVLGAINLRYRLLPHLYSLAGDVALRDASWIRSVAFSYPDDPIARGLKTQFMVGRSLLAAPVLRPTLFGPNSTPLGDADTTAEVYLPGKHAWYDFWTGAAHAGGQTLRTPTTLAHMPLYVRAGSILPLGPRVSHSGEQIGAPLELRIYPGADATYSLYEDAGEGMGYQKDEYSVTPMAWDDSARKLTIGPVRGGYPGRPTEREFRVVLVAPGQGCDLGQPAHFESVRHSGEIAVVHLR